MVFITRQTDTHSNSFIIGPGVYHICPDGLKVFVHAHSATGIAFILALSLLTQYLSLSCVRAGLHHVLESGQARTFADSLELETDTYVHSNLCIEREVWYIPKMSLDIWQNTMLYVRTYLTYSVPRKKYAYGI